MAKKKSSDLRELLVLIRRIIVLAVAAFGLWREMPYETLAIRVAILWAVISLASESLEVLFRYLSNRARDVIIHDDSPKTDDKQVALEKTGLNPTH
jgi:hypothetical protein